ncbi:MAG: TIGR03545 family protein [Deltaproteobacteria bacterium]|nr:TIGR03545 family protein [Deltaproteobacteria bacterium]
MIRKSFLAVIGVVTLLFVAGVWLLDDIVVAGMVEKTIEAMTDGPTTLRGLDLAPTDMRVTWGSLSIQDPDKPWLNMVQTGSADFDVKGMQLFAKKLVVNRMALRDISLGRLRPGQGIPEPGKEPPSLRPRKKVEEDKPESGGGFLSLENLKGTLPKVDLTGKAKKEMNLDQVLKPDQMKSVQAVNRTSAMAEERSAYWEKRLASSTLEQDIAAIQRDSKKIKMGGYANALEAAQALEELNKLNQRISKANAEYQEIQQGIDRDNKAIQKSYAEAQALVEQDVAAAKSLAGVGGLNPKEASSMLFGPMVIGQFQQVMGYLQMARKGISGSGEPKPQGLALRQGQWISFPVTSRVYPRFLVERIDLGGNLIDTYGNPTMTLKGTFTGLSSDARLYGKPALLNAEALEVNGGTGRYVVTGRFDHLHDVSVDTLDIKGTGLRWDDIQISRDSEGTWPKTMSTRKGATTVHFVLKDSEMDGTLTMEAHDPQFIFSGNPRTESQRAMQQMFQDFGTLSLTARLRGSLQAPRMDVSSNLDKALSSQISKLVGKQQKDAEDRVRKGVTGQFSKSQDQARQKMDQSRQKLNGRMNAMKQPLDSVSGEVNKAKAEAERKAKKEAEDKLKKEAGKQLQNLMPR